MAIIRLRAFGGMRPARAADLLSPGEAQTVSNAKLQGGDLEPFKGISSVTTLSSVGTVRSIYRYGENVTNETQYWFESTSDMDYVKGPVDGDTEERTYFTGGAYPAKTKADIATTSPPYPTTSLRMGIPAPTTAPSVAVSGTATDPDSTAESVTYVVTYVSAWGEEGPPGPASDVVSWRDGQQIDLTSIPGSPSGNYNITAKRLYRSATGSSNTAFQYLTELTIGDTTHTDTEDTADLDEVLQTDGWNPPDDSMIGLTAMANGMLAGFFGNTLCFSEPGVPSAWPVRYQQSVDAPIVGIGAFDQSLFVGTKTGIYIATGPDPASITMTKLAVAQSCVSKRSVVEMDGGVVFAAPDGLFFINGSGLKNLTEGLFTRDQWQTYEPSTMSAFESDGRCVIFYGTGGVGGLILTFGAEPSCVTTTLYGSAGYRDKMRDALYVVTGSTNLGKWDNGTLLTYGWTSGVFRMATETNLAAGRVEAASYPVTLQLYADGTLVHTQVVANRLAFRLPQTARATRFHFTLSGTATVRSVELATSMRELALD